MVQLRACIEHNTPAKIVATVDELEKTLAEASARSSAEGKLNVVVFHAPNRDHLSLVVGGEETVVGFNQGDGAPPYFVSRGEGDAVAPLLTAYVALEHHTEFPRKWVIPMAQGRRAAFEFLRTGQRPSVVKWVEA